METNGSPDDLHSRVIRHLWILDLKQACKQAWCRREALRHPPHENLGNLGSQLSVFADNVGKVGYGRWVLIRAVQGQLDRLVLSTGGREVHNWLGIWPIVEMISTKLL